MKKVFQLLINFYIQLIVSLIICAYEVHAVDIGEKFLLGEGTTGIKNAPHLNSIGTFISTILPNIFVVAGVIIFFFIFLGGFTMITSAGNPEKQKEGSQMITGAVLGFVIIFGAFWIAQLIGLVLMGNAQAILRPGL